jgi:periplasmic protein TonB
MEQPLHTIRAQQTSWLSPNRLIALGASTVIVVGFGWALAIGLAQTLIEKMPEVLKAEVVQEKIPDKPPPPPPPQLKEPPPPFVPPPEITIQTDAPVTTAITSQSKVATPVAAPPATELHAIMRTHTQPPYPDVAKHLGEQGTVVIRVTITTDGDVSACSVQKTSGSERLDTAACSYVTEHYRWQPPTQNGHPTEAQTLLAITYNLKNQ